MNQPARRAKSYLKALEFAAVGVPVIASDTPANRELAKTVPIRLAHNPQQWKRHLLELVQQPDTRASEGAAARDAVLEQHTHGASAERWAHAWERAMGHASGLGRRQRVLDPGR